jgi:4-amino-4-deoxy-L-arabinose transferase-like glycosyltransferase
VSLLRRLDPALVAILLMAVAFRCYRFDMPYVEAHSWRQVTNADIARLWTEQPINLLFPPVSWGGPNGYVGLEFPLIQALTALVWRVTGHSEPLGRLVPIAFSVASIALIYFLGSRLYGRPTGRAAAFLLAFSPTYVYFGRTLMSDVPMMCFSIGAVLGYANYFFGDGGRRHAIAGAVCLALAGLTKVPAILVLGPVAWTAWLARRSRVFRDEWFLGGVTAALGCIALWYLHADRIYLETGLTQAIFRPSGTYSGELAAFSGEFTTVSHWTDLSEPRMHLQLYAILERFWELHLTRVGFVGAAIGMLCFRVPRRTIADVWMLAGLALLLVSLPGQFNHEFHQLPLLPPLALYFGFAAGPLFDGARLSGWLRAPLARIGALTAAALLWGGLALWSFADSPIFIALYRPNHLNLDLIAAGRAIEAATPRDALLVTVEYDRFGTNSPMLLYYSHRKGWSFDATAIRPVTLQYLRQQGACYLATSHWPLLDHVQRDTANHLKQLREIPLPHTHRDYRLFSLGCDQEASR